jgi:hypothetical protein
MSKWWREIHRILDVKILMSTSFHPQMDGITKCTNQSIAQILWMFIAFNQKDWVKWLTLVEFTINSMINRVMGMAPFEINYGFMHHSRHELPMPERIPPVVRTFAMNALRNMAVAHNSIIAERVFQCHHANRHWCGEPDITQGQLVYLSTKNLTMPKGRTSKLLPKFVGPYKVLQANPESSNYELELPCNGRYCRYLPC